MKDSKRPEATDCRFETRSNLVCVGGSKPKECTTGLGLEFTSPTDKGS